MTAPNAPAPNITGKMFHTTTTTVTTTPNNVLIPIGVSELRIVSTAMMTTTMRMSPAAISIIWNVRMRSQKPERMTSGISTTAKSRAPAISATNREFRIGHKPTASATGTANASGASAPAMPPASSVTRKLAIITKASETVAEMIS